MTLLIYDQVPDVLDWYLVPDDERLTPFHGHLLDGTNDDMDWAWLCDYLTDKTKLDKPPTEHNGKIIYTGIIL